MERNCKLFLSLRSNTLVRNFSSCKPWKISVIFHSADNSCVFPKASFSRRRRSNLFLEQFEFSPDNLSCGKTDNQNKMEILQYYALWFWILHTAAFDYFQRSECSFWFWSFLIQHAKLTIFAWLKCSMVVGLQDIQSQNFASTSKLHVRNLLWFLKDKVPRLSFIQCINHYEISGLQLYSFLRQNKDLLF